MEEKHLQKWDKNDWRQSHSALNEIKDKSHEEEDMVTLYSTLFLHCWAALSFNTSLKGIIWHFWKSTCSLQGNLVVKWPNVVIVGRCNVTWSFSQLADLIYCLFNIHLQLRVVIWVILEKMKTVLSAVHIMQISVPTIVSKCSFLAVD